MNALEKLKQKFKQNSQIGGKGTFRRKTKKKSSLNTKKPVSLFQKRYTKIINQINNFVNEKIKNTTDYAQFYDFTKEKTNLLFDNFKRKDYVKKKIIENKVEFNEQYFINKINSETLFILNYKIIEQHFSSQGIDTILSFYYELWDSINTKEYLGN